MRDTAPETLRDRLNVATKAKFFEEFGSPPLLRPIARLIGAKSPLTALQKGKARQFFTQAVWTRDRLFAAGASGILSCNCDKCGQPDSVFHRLWLCPAVDVTRAESAAATLVAAARAAGPGNIAFTQGYVREKRYELPPPEASDRATWFPAAPAGGVFPHGPRLFIDGSASDPAQPLLRRAGWAVVMLNPSFTHASLALFGPVPAH